MISISCGLFIFFVLQEGSIGHDMVIKPLPHELSPQPEESHHVIYKRSADPLEHLSDFGKFNRN